MKKITQKELKHLIILYNDGDSKTRTSLTDYFWGYWHRTKVYHMRASRVTKGDSNSLAFIALYDAIQEVFLDKTTNKACTFKELEIVSVKHYRRLCKNQSSNIKGDKNQMHKNLSRNSSFRVYDYKKKQFKKVKLDDFMNESVTSSINLLIDLNRDPEQNYIMVETMELIEDWFSDFSNDTRDAFFRFYMYGESMVDIADTLSIDRMTLTRHMEDIKQRLENHLQEKGCSTGLSHRENNLTFDAYQTPGDAINAEQYGSTFFETVTRK